jgi:putative component of toxin-antitoxin plasmid stabilization module
MMQISNLQSLPATKYKPLKGCKDAYTEYEIKTENLRVYLFKEEKTGSIIVCGGKKSTQQKDIQRFRNLKQSYIASNNKI